jgi:hypothetical protein
MNVFEAVGLTVADCLFFLLSVCQFITTDAASSRVVIP